MVGWPPRAGGAPPPRGRYFFFNRAGHVLFAETQLARRARSRTAIPLSASPGHRTVIRLRAHAGRSATRRCSYKAEAVVQVGRRCGR